MRLFQKHYLRPGQLSTRVYFDCRSKHHLVDGNQVPRSSCLEHCMIMKVAASAQAVRMWYAPFSNASSAARRVAQTRHRFEVPWQIKNATGWKRHLMRPAVAPSFSAQFQLAEKSGHVAIGGLPSHVLLPHSWRCLVFMFVIVIDFQFDLHPRVCRK